MSSSYSIIKMGLKLNTLLAIFCLFNVSIAKKDEGRIIGGKAAAPAQFPYQIMSFLDGNQWCGGAIIAPNVVVTAAHCTVGQNSAGFTVRAGSHDISKPDGTEVRVSRVINHPKYNSKINLDYDAALLILATPLKYSSTIKAIQLPTGNEVITKDTVGVVSGFGAINGQKTMTPTLKYVNVRLWGVDECQKSSLMLCAGESHGQQSSCEGDSGGPLVVNNKLYGIVSHGPGCGEAGPAGYTSVIAILDWIKQNANL